VPLELAVERSHCHDGVDIPVIVRDCMDCVQEHGMWIVTNLCACYSSNFYSMYIHLLCYVLLFHRLVHGRYIQSIRN